jgi:hypothetical protein
MRHIKLLVAVVAGLLAVIAIAGASSASATSLCKEASSPCPTEQRYEKGTEFAAEGSTSLESTFTSFTCSTAQIMIRINAASGKPLPMEVNTAEWAGCKDLKGNSCTVKGAGIAWKGSLEWTGGSNAKLVFENAGLEFTCAKETCVYGAAAETGTFVGAEVFKIEIGTTKLERKAGSGLACSTTATLTPQIMGGSKTYYGGPIVVYPAS